MDIAVVRTGPAIAPLDYPAGYHYARFLRRAVAVEIIDAPHLASVWHRRSRAPDICRPERPSAFMSPNRDLCSPTGGLNAEDSSIVDSKAAIEEDIESMFRQAAPRHTRPAEQHSELH